MNIKHKTLHSCLLSLIAPLPPPAPGPPDPFCSRAGMDAVVAL